MKPLLKDVAYQTPWGLYDDTLFDISLNDFKRLSKKSKQKFCSFYSYDGIHTIRMGMSQKAVKSKRMEKATTLCSMPLRVRMN